ncbi:hypothetical protein IDH44_16190 [Paenibacillus sp. IB182496]|uniref:Uncharacterized protein n=1 Tax=Paenibacillus sabuli TaxID=2772509 RepID=A0A927GTH5_9BACL|nr:hypothetical protein [Paenibacillus sabuli]MBD2846737.1 hypothetical protein [Paenibacillus sabuli]
MFAELNEELAARKLEARQAHNWNERLQSLGEQIRLQELENERLRRQMNEEQQDVERLNGMSFATLFYSVIGRKEEKLEREMEEALQAKLAFEEAEDALLSLRQEEVELRDRLAGVRGAQGEITRLMQQKRKLIDTHHPELAARLNELSDHEIEIRANLKELSEAVQAGQVVLEKLGEAAERLESASNWGTWDMFGGGAITTAVKHSRINDARDCVRSAQHSLRRFERELLDVQRDVSVQIEIGGLLTFADFFFDGIITDWIVQGRISDARDEVEAKLSQIRSVTAELQSEQRTAETELQRTSRSMQEYIARAE